MALFWKKAEEKKAVQNMGLSVKVEYVTALQEVRLLDNFSAKIIQRIKDSFSFSFKRERCKMDAKRSMEHRSLSLLSYWAVSTITILESPCFACSITAASSF